MYYLINRTNGKQDGPFADDPTLTLAPGETATPLSCDEARQIRYAKEADPLFFKFSRGEISRDEWTEKVDQIKAEIPKPE